MNFVWGVVIIAAAVAVAVAAMLLVRRRAPDGGYFNDGDRASGVFGVLATGFALLLGLIVFLAFTSYDESKSGAEAEALVVVQQFETAQFLPPAARRQLSGELICYGRSVVGQEWPRMQAGSESGAVNPWGLALFRTMETVVLAMAAVAIAWSGYQASRWTGEQAKAFSRANAARVESTRWSNLANSQTEIDVATFTQWVDAYARNETKLADFYRQRFRKEFKPAVEAWIATRPLKNPDAPLTPFATPQYRLAASAEAERLEAKAGAEAAVATRNIQRATNYVLGVVLFSTALFFGGISTRIGNPRARAVILGMGCVVLFGTLAWIATFPISISI